MIQGDVVSYNGSLPVMGLHSNQATLTLDTWISNILPSNKGMLIHIRQEDILQETLAVIGHYNGSYGQPVWLGADIFEGPNFNDTLPVDAVKFNETVQAYYPELSLVLGWATGPKSDDSANTYTQAMIKEMSLFAATLQQPVIFHVRLIYARDSWDALSELLNESRAYKMLLYKEDTDEVNMDDVNYIRDNSEHGNVYYNIEQ